MTVHFKLGITLIRSDLRGNYVLIKCNKIITFNASSIIGLFNGL